MPVCAGRNRKDHVLLTTYAVADPGATKLRLRDHSIDYEGISGSGVISGVYGTTSTERALQWAHAAAATSGKAVFTVEMHCALENLDLLPVAIGRALMERTGFLHIHRLRAAFSAEIKELVLTHLTRRLSGAALEFCKNVGLSELMMNYPVAAACILKSEPSVQLIVHPVQLRGLASLRRADIGTMRVAKAKTMTPSVKYLEDRVLVTY